MANDEAMSDRTLPEEQIRQERMQVTAVYEITITDKDLEDDEDPRDAVEYEARKQFNEDFDDPLGHCNVTVEKKKEISVEKGHPYQHYKAVVMYS